MSDYTNDEILERIEKATANKDKLQKIGENPYDKEAENKVIEEAADEHALQFTNYADQTWAVYSFEAGAQWALTHKSDEIADKARLHMSLSRRSPMEEKLEIAMEALESIAFIDEPLAAEVEYWESPARSKIAETMALDTVIAREALAKIRGEG